MDSAATCIACGQNWALVPSLLCGGCFARMGRDLAAAAWAHGWLGVTMAALKPSWRPGTIHRDGEPQPPFDVALHDARAAIENGLTGWARLMGEQHVPALAGPADGQITTVAAWLRARLRWAGDQGWCDQFAYDLASWRSDAYALAPWEPIRQDLALPCPGRGCGRLTLAYYQGSDGVTCRTRSCGHTMAWSDYLAMVADWRRRNTRAAA